MSVLSPVSIKALKGIQTWSEQYYNNICWTYIMYFIWMTSYKYENNSAVLVLLLSSFTDVETEAKGY